jgi:hypothetical protein
MFFVFTLRALTKRSSQQQFYLDARDLKSAWSVRNNRLRLADFGAVQRCRVSGRMNAGDMFVTQSLQFRHMTRRASRFIERPIMSIITVKSPLRKVTPDTRVNMTDRRQYRRSLVLRSFRQLSRSYFASGKSWEFVIEALLFAIIVATSAWPVFAVVDALSQFLQRTAS